MSNMTHTVLLKPPASACLRVPGELEDWGAMFDSGHSTTGGAYRATVDYPGCGFYQQLMAAYPDAKVILTERDPEKWYQSVINTIGRRYNMEHKQPWYLKKLGLTVKLTKFWNMLDDLVWSGDWQRKMNDDPEGLKKLFVDHNEEVKRTVPADKLLVCMTAGWKPVNDQIERNINRVRMMVNTATAVAVAGLVALLASRQANKK
eukprot:jgi/Chrzof1/5136/Cz15g12220.t1